MAATRGNDSSIWESEKLKSTQYLNLLKDLKLLKRHN
ncbi:MAG: hypothetical protein RLZZ292_57 [Bacteroidota bacterium]|jgi:hypothetical protein